MESMGEYFVFEKDFVEKGIRCIPMIVRLKMDMAGIKLKLAHWSRFQENERITLSVMDCANITQRMGYKGYLTGLIKKYTGEDAIPLAVDENPAWQDMGAVAEELQSKAMESGWRITMEQWINLSDLQRFALLKLCRPGHENLNFPRAMEEFGWPAAGCLQGLSGN